MSSLSELFGIGFDEATFALVTGLLSLQKTKHFTTDRAALELLRSKPPHTPHELFPAPPFPKVNQQNVPVPWQINPEGRHYKIKHLTFPSAYPLGYPENDMVHGYYLYRPGHETAPTIFYLHGWMAASPPLWLRPPLTLAHPLGLNIFFLEQPFHMHRSPSGTSSGQLTMSGDLLLGLESVKQSVSDVRSCLAWLKKQGVEKVALAGRSLGGLVAATTLTVEDGFTCAVLDIPAVSPHTSIWRSNYTRLVREELRSQGFGEQETATLFEVIRPGRFDPAIQPEKILLIEATADRACLPYETERFAREWNLPTVRVALGHMSIIFSRQAKVASRQFLAKWLLDV